MKHGVVIDDITTGLFILGLVFFGPSLGGLAWGLILGWPLFWPGLGVVVGVALIALAIVVSHTLT